MCELVQYDELQPLVQTDEALSQPAILPYDRSMPGAVPLADTPLFVSFRFRDATGQKIVLQQLVALQNVAPIWSSAQLPDVRFLPVAVLQLFLCDVQLEQKESRQQRAPLGR